MIHLSQNFIFDQSKWEVSFQFFMKLIRYLFAQQIKFLNVFNQIENKFLFNRNVWKHSFKTDEKVWRLNFKTDENAQKHSFLIKTASLFIQFKIICSQSDFWSNNYLQWQHSNQIFCFRIYVSNLTAVLLTHFNKYSNCKLVDKHWHQIINLSWYWIIFTVFFILFCYIIWSLWWFICWIQIVSTILNNKII